MPYICAVILSKGKQRFSGGALYAWPLRGLRCDHAQGTATLSPVGWRLRYCPCPLLAGYHRDLKTGDVDRV
jgi:hypothetical protein